MFSSATPVPTPVAYVGAGDVCVGNDASSTLLDFDATMSGWTEVDDVQDDGSAISSPCAWTAYAADSVDYLQVLGLEINGADGSSSYAIHQTSNAWGNYPGDNTLTGCNLLYNTSSYTNFILEAKMYHSDNDGVGFVFGGPKGLKSNPIGDLKKLVAAQSGTRPEKIRSQKWYTIFKDHITLEDYEIHDGMGLELYYN